MRIKRRLKLIALRGFEATGRYKPLEANKMESIPSEAIVFAGDLPRGAGKELLQHRTEFRVPRMPQVVRDLYYTARGMAWKDGTLYECHSIQEPSLRDLYYRPIEKPSVILGEGTVVQAETPYTYGDWVSEYLCTVAVAMPLASPLLMPVPLMAKSYIRRDLGLLGIETYTVERTVLIRNATVLPKRRHSHNFTREEVLALRRGFEVDPVPARPGSV